jgi:adenylosuccinate synthase
MSGLALFDLTQGRKGGPLKKKRTKKQYQAMNCVLNGVYVKACENLKNEVKEMPDCLQSIISDFTASNATNVVNPAKKTKRKGKKTQRRARDTGCTGRGTIGATSMATE